MDALALIASLVQSLAWPVAVVLISFMFRKSLADLIPGLKRLRFKDMELEFGRQLEVIRLELEPAPPAAFPAADRSTRLALPEPKGTTHYYRSLAEVSPRAAIIESWLEFELAANAAHALIQPSPRRVVSMPRLFDVLAEAELLTAPEVDALTKLRGLRNEVVHGPEPELSVDVIAEYALLLQGITEELRKRVNRRANS